MLYSLEEEITKQSAAAVLALWDSSALHLQGKSEEPGWAAVSKLPAGTATSPARSHNTSAAMWLQEQVLLQRRRTLSKR